MIKKGIALVTTMMILMMLSLLATGMMFTIKNETAISIYQASNVQVISVAESALDEVKHRMNLDPSDSFFIGDTSAPLNVDWETFILFTDELPTDTLNTHYATSIQSFITGFSSDNPELDYTTIDFDENLSLRVRHKTAYDSLIYFFDSKTQKQFLGPPSLVVEYPPVEVVEITARSGKAVKKIQAEISKQEVNIKVRSALSAATIVLRSTGNVDPYVCGHNHMISTPYNVIPLAPGTSISPAVQFPGTPVSCWKDATSSAGAQQLGVPLYHISTPIDSVKHNSPNHYYYNILSGGWAINRMEYDEFCSRTGCLAGIATTSANMSAFGASKSHIFGNPDIIVKYDVVIPELFEILGYTSEAEMMDNITWNDVTSLPNNPSEIAYYHVTSATGVIKSIPSGTQTQGILWIDGDLDLKSGNGYFQHKGLVYVDGSWLGNVSGTTDSWILGAMVVKDSMDVHTTGNARIFFLYSSEAITNTVESDLEYFKLLGWKEII